MGFIDAVYTIGKEFSSKTDEITDYLSQKAIEKRIARTS
jgi:hypothetical protein